MRRPFLISMVDFTKYPLPRIRHHTNPNFYLPYKSFKIKPKNYPLLVKEIDWKKVFLNGNLPSSLDVGCGLGKFLIEFASQNKNKNILGFEVRQKAVEWINNVIDSENIPNASALWYSVANGIKFITDESIEKIFYFFPDPWIKKRHHKRRALTLQLIDEFHRVLKPKGKVYTMTDVSELDKIQVELFLNQKKFKQKLTDESKWKLNVRSNQEEFCLNKKIQIIRRIFLKNN